MDKQLNRFLDKTKQLAMMNVPIQVGLVVIRLRETMHELAKMHTPDEDVGFDLTIEELIRNHTCQGVAVVAVDTNTDIQHYEPKSYVNIMMYQENTTELLVTFLRLKNDGNEEFREYRHYCNLETKSDTERVRALSHGLALHSMTNICSDIISYVVQDIFKD